MKIAICGMWILIFQNANVVYCNQSDTQNEPEDVSVDLKNIHDKDFDVVQSIIEMGPSNENKLESYKLTPKANKKIKKISFGDIDVCDANESMQCVNITIYNFEPIYFVIKTSRDEDDDYIYLRYYKKYLGATSPLQFLLDVNHAAVAKRGTKSLTLNVSSEFDKLYYKHRYKEKDGHRYETFTPNRNENFGKVTDNIDTIWESEDSADKQPRCVRVQVYKEQKTGYNRSTGKRQVVMSYRFLILEFDGGALKYLELDDKLNKWVEIDRNEFNLGSREYLRRGVKQFKNGESGLSASGPADERQLLTLELFKRHKWFEYEMDSIGDFRMVTLYNASIFGVDRIKHNDQLLLDIGKRTFYMNVSMDGGGTVYVEIVFKVDSLHYGELVAKRMMAEKIAAGLYAIYYMRTDGRKDFVHMSRSYFLDDVKSGTGSGDGHADIKYSNICELRGGAAVEKMSRELKLKINPEYVEKSEKQATEQPGEDASSQLDDDQAVDSSHKEVVEKQDVRLRGHNSEQQDEPTDHSQKSDDIGNKHNEHEDDDHKGEEQGDDVAKAPKNTDTNPKTGVKNGLTDEPTGLDDKDVEIDQDNPEDGMQNDRLDPEVLVDKLDDIHTPTGPKNDTEARDTTNLENFSHELKFPKTIEELSRSEELIRKISKYSSILSNTTGFNKKRSGYLSNISSMAVMVCLGLNLI